MSNQDNGDWGDLVNGDHERDLGSRGRYRPTLRAQLTAQGIIQLNLVEGLQRIEAAAAQACPACGQKTCDCGPGKAA